MAFTLLYIRLKQLQRELNGLGLYVLPFAAIAGYLAYIFFKQFEQGKNVVFLLSGLTVICFTIQFYRKDKSFIYKHIAKPHVQIFSEYLALTLPFSVSSIFTESWLYYPLFLLLIYCIPFVKFQFRQRTVLKNLSSVISPDSFEWISGIRKQFIPIISLYVLAAGFCWFRILPLLLLWLITILITSFHTECESIQILREQVTDPTKFLLQKIKTNSIYIIILYTPLIIINTIFNKEFFLINMLFIPMQISLVCFAICLKYSLYRPNKIQTANNIPLAIVSLGSLLPHLIPVPAILSVIYFYKAGNNLQNYLND